MDADNKNTLPDVQSARDGRNIAIDRVGVRGITVPITVETKEDTLATVATVEMTVSLPADKKGTHMSRFVALMEEHFRTAQRGRRPLSHGRHAQAS